MSCWACCKRSAAALWSPGRLGRETGMLGILRAPPGLPGLPEVSGPCPWPWLYIFQRASRVISRAERGSWPPAGLGTPGRLKGGLREAEKETNDVKIKILQTKVEKSEIDSLTPLEHDIFIPH